MSGKAAKIMLTEGQHAILQQIIRSTTAPQRLAQRARLIVLAFGGMFNGAIGGAIGLRRKQVGLWRRRWKQSFDAMVAIECRESQANRGGRLTSGPGENSPTNSFSVASCRPFRPVRSTVIWPRPNCNRIAASLGSTLRRKTRNYSRNKSRSSVSAIWKPRQPARIEFAYTRHGTSCLTGNLNTHCSQSLVRYVARLEGIDPSTLGQKDKSGILKSMASRQAFLSDRSHRIRFVYLPKHSSWLNQIEIVFGIVTRRVVRRGNFKSTEALRMRLLDFIDYFNRTFAKPFRWTYTGRPVAAATVKRPTTWKEKWGNRRQSGESLVLAG